MSNTIKTVGSRLVIRMNERKTVSDGGIHLPEVSVEANTEGTVIAVGPRCEHLKEGDVIGFPKHLGTRCVINNTDYLFLEERQVAYVRQ